MDRSSGEPVRLKALSQIVAQVARPMDVLARVLLYTARTYPALFCVLMLKVMNLTLSQNLFKAVLAAPEELHLFLLNGNFVKNLFKAVLAAPDFH
jgi:hypothetical protein